MGGDRTVDIERLEQKLRDHFQDEVLNAEPSSEWWDNATSGLGEQKPGPPGAFRFRRVGPAGRRFAAVAAVAAAAIIIISLSMFQPWNTSPDSQSVIAKACELTAEIQSYRMTFSGIHESNGTALHLSAEAEFSSPGEYSLKLVLEGKTNEYLSAGGTKYIQDSEKLAGWNVIFNTSSVPDKETTIKSLGQLIDIQQLPDEKIDGIICFRYRGRYPDAIEDMIAEIKSKLTEDQIRQMQDVFDRMRTVAEVDFWIGKGDYLIRQEQMNIRNLAGEIINSSTVKLFDFNEPVEIIPPLDSNGQLLPGWRIENSLPAPGAGF